MEPLGKVYGGDEATNLLAGFLGHDLRQTAPVRVFPVADFCLIIRIRP
jgi:hypothetical protein